MKLKKAFAITAAALLSIPCLSGLSASAQGYNAYLAGVYGESQENAVWSFSDGDSPVPADCTTALIDGDGTYEVEWVMQNPLMYGPRTEFMCLFIDDLNNQTYPALNIVVDEVLVDGTAIEYTQSANACDYNYNGGEMTRVYFKDNWAGSKVADIDEYIQINNSIKIVFTVSGMGFDGSGSSGDSSGSGDTDESSLSQSESESSSVSESKSESSSVSESESESSSVSESKTSSVSEVSSSSSSSESSSTADDSDEKSGGGVKTWMILVGVLGVAAVAAAIVIIIKIRKSKYYL